MQILIVIAVVVFLLVKCGKTEKVEVPEKPKEAASSSSADDIDSRIVFPSSQTGSKDMNDGVYQERAMLLCKAAANQAMPGYSFSISDMKIYGDDGIGLILTGRNWGDKAACTCEAEMTSRTSYPGVRLTRRVDCFNR